MIQTFRQQFNQQFTNKQYQDYQKSVQNSFNLKPQFRLLETPVFLPDSFVSQLKSASLSIIEQLQQKNFRSQAHQAISPNWLVPNEDQDPVFLQFDFAITLDENNQISPQLIELQGFPALFFFQIAAFGGFQSSFNMDGLTPYYDGLNSDRYLDILKRSILGNHEPEEVILLEFDPWNQKTAIDFAGANQLLNIPVVDIQKIKIKNSSLFYRNKKNQEIRIKRIFNRVILDELDQKNSHNHDFNLRQEVDVEWAGHPNWFLKYSKFALPFLQGEFVPRSFFLDQWTEHPGKLKDRVLKPIYSFSGNGVHINPTLETIQKIQHKKQYILQEKIKYAQILPSPQNQFSQVEVRVMLIQNPKNPKKYQFMTNLVRAGKDGIIGTQHQQKQNWIGGGIALMNG